MTKICRNVLVSSKFLPSLNNFIYFVVRLKKENVVDITFFDKISQKRLVISNGILFLCISSVESDERRHL